MSMIQLMSFQLLINRSRLSWLNMISHPCLSFFFIFLYLSLELQISAAKHLAPDKTPFEATPSKVHSVLSFSYLILVIYIQHSHIQDPPSSAITTNGCTDNEQEIKVIMLASKNSVLSGLLSCTSGPVSFCIIPFIISFSYCFCFQGSMQVNGNASTTSSKLAPAPTSGLCKGILQSSLGNLVWVSIIQLALGSLEPIIHSSLPSCSHCHGQYYIALLGMVVISVLICVLLATGTQTSQSSISSQ